MTDANKKKPSGNNKDMSTNRNSELKINCYDFPIESNHSDRAEALKCIEKAIEAFKNEQYDKAERFILKSIRICESRNAKTFLETIRTASAQNNNNVNVEKEKCNEPVNNLSLNEEIKLFHKRKLAKSKRNVNTSENTFTENCRVKHLQDINATLHQSDVSNSKTLIPTHIETGYKIGNAGECNLEKQQSEQMDRQKSTSKDDIKKIGDELVNFKLNGDSDTMSDVRITCKECIDKALNAYDEGDWRKALRLLTKAERIHPTAKAKDLMKQVKEKLEEIGENPDEVMKEVKKSVVKKNADVSQSQMKRKGVTREQITEVQRVMKAKDCYDVLGKLTKIFYILSLKT